MAKKKKKRVVKQNLEQLYQLTASEYSYHIRKKDSEIESHKEIATIVFPNNLKVSIGKSKHQLHIYIGGWKYANPDLVIDEDGKIVEYYSHF